MFEEESTERNHEFSRRMELDDDDDDESSRASPWTSEGNRETIKDDFSKYTGRSSARSIDAPRSRRQSIARERTSAKIVGEGTMKRGESARSGTRNYALGTATTSCREERAPVARRRNKGAGRRWEEASLRNGREVNPPENMQSR